MCPVLNSYFTLVTEKNSCVFHLTSGRVLTISASLLSICLPVVRSFFLGMLNYVGFCGSEVIAVKVKRCLEVFDLQLSEVPIHITYCGSDVRKVSELVHAFHFPCLAHVIILIVQRFLLQITNASNDDGEPDSDDEDEYQNPKKNNEVKTRAKDIVAKTSRTPKLTDQLKSAQKFSRNPIYQWWLLILLDGTLFLISFAGSDV